MKVKELIDHLQEYNSEAEIEVEIIKELPPQAFEIYYRGGPNNNNKKTCEYIRIYIGKENEL